MNMRQTLQVPFESQFFRMISSRSVFSLLSFQEKWKQIEAIEKEEMNTAGRKVLQSTSSVPD